MGKVKFSEEVKAALIRDINSGMKRKDVSVKYGCSLGHCTEILKANGVRLKRSPSQTAKDNAIALYLGGLSIQSAATQADISEATLKRELKRQEIDYRQPIYAPRKVDENGLLLCWSCKKMVPLGNFSLRWRTKNPVPHCKECCRKKAAVYREKPTAKVKARDRYFIANYGITAEEYDRRHAEQGGVCAICKLPETARIYQGKIRDLSVDHDHETGEVRGLLCGRCNRALGLFQDNAETLKSALIYLGDAPVFD